MDPAGRRRHASFAACLAIVAMALGLTAPPATASPPDPHIDYVALGDSYTAGTGAGDWSWTYPCIQTAGGYVDVLDTLDAVDLLANNACHGSLLRDTAQPGNVPSVADQVAQLAAAGKLSRGTELVSMTAGANDVGVNVVLFTCATSTATDCSRAVKTAVTAMPAVGAVLVRTFAAIHKQAPKAKIAVPGYPRLFNPAGAPVIPVENQRLVNQGTALLNATIAAAAATAKALYGANVQYVDVTARFAGHEVNTADPWIFYNPNPIPGPDGAPTVDQRNFHPNAEGHRQYAFAVQDAVRLPELARR